MTQKRSDPVHDWPFYTWLRLAVIRFGLSPESFWKMTVSDWFTLIKSPEREGLVQTDLQGLMAIYPDKKDTYERSK